MSFAGLGDRRGTDTMSGCTRTVPHSTARIAVAAVLAAAAAAAAAAGTASYALDLC